MLIRHAYGSDIPSILALGEEFGHRMNYMKDPELLAKYVDRILVAEDVVQDIGQHTGVVGFYHYIVSTDPGFSEMAACYKQIPDCIMDRIKIDTESNPICLMMQGGSHREVFREFVKYLQREYKLIACWCSEKSARPKTYEELGFKFDRPGMEARFFNVNKGDYSTYRLGVWRKWEWVL
jgi:hypothetical protein